LERLEVEISLSCKVWGCLEHLIYGITTIGILKVPKLSKNFYVGEFTFSFPLLPAYTGKVIVSDRVSSVTRPQAAPGFHIDENFIFFGCREQYFLNQHASCLVTAMDRCAGSCSLGRLLDFGIKT